MTATLQPQPTLRLPDIQLSELPEAVKDFLIAASAAGKPIKEVMREVLLDSAAAHGFRPSPTGNP